jgi:cysteine desulfurase
MWQNPSSLYSSSVKVRNAVEQARNTVAKFINANSDEIIFTSGGSESNCSVIQGFVQYCRSIGRKSSVITSKIEHKSIILSVESVAEDFHFVDVDSEGFIRLDSLWSILNSIPKDTLILVSLQFANNEIGTIQHIKEISEIVHSFGGVFHTDAVQAFGHEKIDVKKLGIDLLSASGHKIGTPKGIGILYKKKGVNILPIIYGTQEHGMRGGTENVPYIIGLAKAVELLNTKGIYDSNFIENEYHLKHCRNYLLNKLEQMGCVLNGSYHR